MDNIIDLAERKALKEGKIVVNPNNGKAYSYSDRTVNIVNSLKRINKLIAELKQLSKEQTK